MVMLAVPHTVNFKNYKLISIKKLVNKQIHMWLVSTELTSGFRNP